MNPRDIWRGTAVRAAILYAGTISVAVVAVFIAIYVEVGSELDDRLRVRTRGLHETFVSLDRGSGFEALKRTVAEQAASSPRPDRIFLIVDADGLFVAGNIEPIPRFSDWRYLDRSDIKASVRLTSDESRFLSRWSTLPNGAGILIGLSDHDVQEAREALLEGLAYGVAATVLVAIAVGVWLGAMSQWRIQAIGRALDHVARGNLGVRVPLAGSGDDLDQVAGRVNAMLDQMGRLVESLRQVSADIAHELKTPVGHLRQDLETALNAASSSEDLRGAVAQAIEQVDHINEVFEALLRIAQIEAGTRRARFEALWLTEIVENAVDIYRQVAEDAGHSLSVQLPAVARQVDGDRELLTQMLANLLENSIRHCPRGTQILLALEFSPAGPVIQVRDDGPGIPEDERENVQRRLYRLEKSRSTPGTGLGLSLVRAVADLHGAKVVLGGGDPGLSVTIRFPPSLLR